MEPAALIYRFGVFELDLRSQQLRRDGVLVPLQEQPLRLLQTLLEQPGAVVGRDELRDRLWEPGVHVDFAAGLHSAVRRVREALRDDADNPRFIQTVPRRGYRFLAPVERIETTETPPVPASGPSPPAPPAPVPTLRRRLGWVVASWLVAALLTLLMLAAISRLRLHSDGVFSIRPSIPAEAIPTPPASEIRTHFERARHFADRRSREGLEKAIAEYQSGLALAGEGSSLRALGYSGLATSYVMLGFYDYWRPTDAFAPARTFAERALALDDRSAAAHLAMSLVHAVSDWNWASSEASLDRALAADPELVEAHLWRAILLSNLARHDEALVEIDLALAAEPVHPVLNTARGWLLFVARRSDAAVEQSRRTLELAPNYYDAWDNLKWFHITRGELPEAARAWARATQLEDGDGDGLLAAYARDGFEPLLRASIAKKLTRQRQGYSSPYDLALDYATLGEIDPALDQLERSHAEHETDLMTLAVDPRLDALRGEERFQALLDSLNLSSPTKEAP